MKKKGFTLAELIAVIAILAILMLLATGVFINVQRSVLQGQYENLVMDIENKAEDYAEDIGTTDVIYINVDYLISQGYIQADDEDHIYDPRDNTIMNCYMVHIIFEDGEYKADFVEDENLINDDGTCDVTDIDTGKVDLLCNGTACNNGWYDTDVKLNISGLTAEELANSTVEWTSLLGTYEFQDVGTEKTITISPSNVLNTTYNITIITPEETYKIDKNIRIDKETPILISNRLDVDYTTNQELVIEASDMSGSGLAGFAIISKDGDCSTASYVSGGVPVKQAGDLKVCMKDNAGNISEESITINQVTFNYNNTSSDTITKVPVYFLDENANYPLPVPDRNGYTFDEWVDNNGDRVYSFEELENGDEVNATWDIIDVEIPVDKIDKDTVGVLIENKINMILVLDDSGSMSGSPIRNLKSVANNLIDSMSFTVGSTISIIRFTGSASTLLAQGRSASEAKSIISSFDGSGGTDFANALDETYYLLRNHYFNKDETFVIFVSDGYGGSPGSYASMVRSMVNTVYAIGIEDADASTLRQIASPGCYFNSSSGLDSLSEIFTKIQDEIREEVKIKSVDGLIALPNLYVTTEYPFILNVGTGDMEFPSISSISDILTRVGNTYYLDLEKVDNKYKLNGNVNKVNFTYYYS